MLHSDIVCDIIQVMTKQIGHFRREPTAHPLFNEADKQVGWVFSDSKAEATPQHIMLALAWAEYVNSPYCSHSASDFETLTSYQKMLHNPSYESNPLYGGKFHQRHKAFHFYDFPEWKKSSSELLDTPVTHLPESASDNYGLVGFGYIDTEHHDPDNKKIEIYLEDNLLNVCVNEDLRPNSAYWEKGNYCWFNLSLPFSDYQELTQHSEPIVSIHHTPILSWNEPDVSFATELGLFNWLFFEEH
tara:strand:+ start:161 stop:892 length:732 start_codon:yes stop_codon:yes gene_type:complete